MVWSLTDMVWLQHWMLPVLQLLWRTSRGVATARRGSASRDAVANFIVMDAGLAGRRTREAVRLRIGGASSELLYVLLELKFLKQCNAPSAVRSQDASATSACTYRTRSEIHSTHLTVFFFRVWSSPDRRMFVEAFGP